MKNIGRLAVIPVVALLAACGGNEEAKIDDALSRDLALAAQMQPYPQFVSPMELGYQQNPQGYMQGYPQPYGQVQQYPQQAVYRGPAPAPRPTARRSTGTRSAPARTEPIRHTKRDAIIGATAGAVAGASIGRDVKGALIGAAAGGLLGAVVGHTIDVERP